MKLSNEAEEWRRNLWRKVLDQYEGEIVREGLLENLFLFEQEEEEGRQVALCDAVRKVTGSLVTAMVKDPKCFWDIINKTKTRGVGSDIPGWMNTEGGTVSDELGLSKLWRSAFEKSMETQNPRS